MPNNGLATFYACSACVPFSNFQIFKQAITVRTFLMTMNSLSLSKIKCQQKKEGTKRCGIFILVRRTFLSFSLRKCHVCTNNDEHTTLKEIFLFEHNIHYLTKIMGALFAFYDYECFEIIDDLITFSFICHSIEISDVCCKSLPCTFVSILFVSCSDLARCISVSILLRFAAIQMTINAI